MFFRLKKTKSAFIRSKRQIKVCSLLIGFTFLTTKSYCQSITAEVIKPVTLRQLGENQKDLVLVDSIYGSKLPIGTKLSFTLGNNRAQSPYEDDTEPGQILSQSMGEWQQGLKIDVLPGYSESLRADLNKKRIFISVGVLQGYLKINSDTLQSNLNLSLSGGSNLQCLSVLENKMRSDGSLSHKLRKNFPSVFAKTMSYYKKYSSKLKQGRFVIIDYDVPSTEKRFLVINLDSCSYRAEYVAHGQGNGNVSLKVCAQNSKSRQNKTRHGLFKTAGWHTTTKNWPVLKGSATRGRGIKGVKMESLVSGFNSDVLSNGVVFHEASYVGAHRRGIGQGRSWGCPAMEKGKLKSIAPTILEDTLVYIHAPACGYYKK